MVLLCGCLPQPARAPTDTVLANPANVAAAAYHEQVLAYLGRTDAVVPRPLPGVHPVRTAYNPEAIIPPQCYTRTAARFNPCYVCHQREIPGRENVMNDDDLQVAYSFSDVGMTNHWRNLFEDRSDGIASISDDEIRAWVNDDNYSALAPRLRQTGFTGWIPDLEASSAGLRRSTIKASPSTAVTGWPSTTSLSQARSGRPTAPRTTS